MRAYLSPTNDFGHHNNPHFYFYKSYVNQGNNWSSYGLHQVEFRNDTDSVIEVVGWTMKEGRVEEGFKSNLVRPGLFYTARCVPFSWGTHKSVAGAVTFKVQGTNQFYTLAFEDPLHNYNTNGFKGLIEEGNNPEKTLASLKDNSPKKLPWGSYEFQEEEGRGKSVFVLRSVKK